ncbi:MAG: GH3 auxin-responsive promoter family protein [Caldilineaceae bacterium]|nr:GH3 auxin-responsive promoter family protein [Caldilineaceae bacterium]
MMGLAPLANGLWLASGTVDRGRFRWTLSHPAAAQASRLRQILTANQQSEFGRKHGFAQISSVREFQARVPLADYEDFAPAIARMAAGESGVLTTAPVKLFEPSSGSTAAAKLIPYTAALQREFQAGLAAWIGNLYGQMPRLIGGPAYWSLTPLTRGRQSTPGGIPIGFEEDSAYLGPLGRLVEAALAVPNQVKQVGAMDAFRYTTLRHLLATPDLRLISVWNPTFLTLLLDALVQWWEPLLEDVAAGKLTLDEEIDPGLHAQLSRGLRPDPARARQLRLLDPTDLATLAQVWPRLGLVSCWADGPAARFATELMARLPSVLMQPKGLLATEAMVSLPWLGAPRDAPGALLALTSHFLEFVDEGGAVYLTHELQEGSLYSVVVTTGGGLYRYQLHDQVEVVGRVMATPRVRFVGKTDRVADWFGEKLNEQFVARCLEELWTHRGMTPRFALVAPADLADGFAYTLYVEADQWPDADSLAAALDKLLCRNFHYDYCRRLGQLAPARVRAVREGAATYLAICQARGMKLGNIKPALLDRGTEWEGAFTC